MKINKIISFFLTIIILLFSFCPLAFASVEDNIVSSNLRVWEQDFSNNFITQITYDPEDKISTIRFRQLTSSNNNNNLSNFYYYFDNFELYSNENYELTFDFKDNNLQNVSFEIYMMYGPDDFVKLFEYSGGDRLTYKTVTIKHKTPEYFSVVWTPNLIFSFDCPVKTATKADAFMYIRDLSFGVADSVEGNILKRIYNFIINLPSTFQNFFTDLKNGISSFFSDLTDDLSTWFDSLKTSIGGFFTDLKDNLSNKFDNLKTSIGNFFSNLSDNLSGFFNKLKNWLLWFNAEGSGSYVNPFDQVDDDIDDDLESNIVKLANYINDNTQSVSDSLASVGSVFLVFDTFVVGIPLVLSLIIFAFFIHILKRLLGF